MPTRMAVALPGSGRTIRSETPAEGRDAAAAHGVASYRTVLDVDDVTFMDSSGINALTTTPEPREAPGAGYGGQHPVPPSHVSSRSSVSMTS